MSTALKKSSVGEVAHAGAEGTRHRGDFQPDVDICELPGELVLIADMPGVASDGIEVQFDSGTLSIFGKVEDRQPQGTRYIWNEYALGDYHRTFQVSEVIDSKRITAEYSGGLLTLHLPKVEAAQPRRIEVKTK